MAEAVEAFASTLDQPVRLQSFEGPLDLLLYLIRRNEVDIYNIPIGEITRQYLDVLYSMERLRLDVAGDFFVMAATLMQIKSRLLLPIEARPGSEEEEGDDPRLELVQQLLEYQRFKQAAEELVGRMESAQDLLPRETDDKEEEPTERPLQPITRLDIWTLFNQVLRRLAERMQVGQIEDETITVAERMEFILERIKRETSFRFTSLFPDDEPLSYPFVAASFLAILELTRLGHLSLRQSENFADIECAARDRTAEEQAEKGASAGEVSEADTDSNTELFGDALQANEEDN